MRPATGVDAEHDFDILIDEDVHQVANGVLRLRDRHAVSRYNDDATGYVQEHCHFFSRGRFDGRIDFVGGLRVSRGAERAEQDGRPASGSSRRTSLW